MVVLEGDWLLDLEPHRKDLDCRNQCFVEGSHIPLCLELEIRRGLARLEHLLIVIIFISILIIITFLAVVSIFINSAPFSVTHSP